MTPNRLALFIRTLAVALLMLGGMATAPAVSASETSIASNAEALSAFAGFSNPCLTVPTAVGYGTSMARDCELEGAHVAISGAACLLGGTAAGIAWKAWKLARAAWKRVSAKGLVGIALGACGAAALDAKAWVACLVTSDVPPLVAEIDAMIADLEAMMEELDEGEGEGVDAGDPH